MSSIRGEIEELNPKLMASYAAGDFTGVSSLYTEDCKFMAPCCPMVSGRAAVAKMFQSDYESGLKSLKVEEEEIGTAGGDVIYSRGVYTFSKEDGTVGDFGKYVILWKRVDGQLYFYTDVFNSDKS